MDADAIVVGTGLAGLVATAELADARRRVILLDQEPVVSLGGLETDLDGRVLRAGGEPIPGLFAAGEVGGFGGGGMHGYRALEGTFLGGCLSGRAAGRAVAAGR